MSSVLDLLATHEVWRFDPGQIVIRQGERSGILFFLIEGTVEVLMNDTPVCTARQPGTVFGEVSALIGRNHVVTVRASSACAFYAVKNPRAFLASTPAVCLHVCEALAHRIDALSQYLADVKEQFEGHDHIGMVSQVLETLMYRERRVRPRRSASRRGQLTD
ncbi:MAG: cyclic nucleotide-binding domain-containing protein [Verrucomicrobia bacterium]|nr:cyclic nucleotide-binding domain-containing protein [Verrucomicrobiota bacterium]